MVLHPFDPERLLDVLLRHKVRFVVIGGIAGRLLGSPTLTNDLDVCYARDRKNLAALSAALTELDARLRGAPEELPFRPDAPTLEAGDHFTLTTRAGNLDCIGTPAGSAGFHDLIGGATVMKVGKLKVPVVAIEDLMRLKQAAGRPKDRVELEILGALKAEIYSPERKAEFLVANATDTADLERARAEVRKAGLKPPRARPRKTPKR